MGKYTCVALLATSNLIGGLTLLIIMTISVITSALIGRHGEQSLLRCRRRCCFLRKLHVKNFAEKKEMFLSITIPLMYYVKVRRENARKTVRLNDLDTTEYIEESLPHRDPGMPLPVSPPGIPVTNAGCDRPKISDPYVGKSESAEDRRRREAWEEGRIDYMGVDSMDNIIAKLNATLHEPQYHPHTHLPNKGKVHFIAANAPSGYPSKDSGVEYW